MKKLRHTFLGFLLVLSILSCTTKQKSTTDFQRSVNLEQQPNFRDLGNYKTEEGKTVQTQLLFRSGTLAKITDEDVQELEELGINTVVNFLDKGEIERYGKDKLPEGVKSVYLPIEGSNNEAATILEARQTGDFSKVPVDFNYEIHAVLVDDAKEAYKGLFKVLAEENNYPVVFHCSHGVHRTGTAAALVLRLLGVPWETITEDYLLSNETRKEETEKRVAALNDLALKSEQVTNKEENLKNIEAFYILQPEYIDGTINQIENKYGTVENYLQEIGVTNEEIIEIKRIILNK